MATAVELPQFGNTVEECLIARWISRMGDTVAAGDVIVEIETDKTTFEVTAPVDGVILATFFDEGALVPVFTNVCVIGAEGESAEQFRPAGRAQRDSEAAEEVRSGGAFAGVSERSESTAAPPTPPISPGVSPRALKFAREHSLDLESITGSGPGGRVIEQDVRAALQSAARPEKGLPHFETGLPHFEMGQARFEMGQARSPRTASGPRAIIARRMRESLATTAQYTMHASANAAGLLAARRRLKTADITINDLVTFCTVKALVASPGVNATFVDGAIVTHDVVHIGFACDTPRGLMVPVVRDAQHLSLADLAARLKALAAQAKDGKISPDDLRGATFTVSNLGALGVESFTPILNPPQVAILGVDAIQLKPVRDEDGIGFIDAIGLSLTCDHQVIDGAPGARFLQKLKEKIEAVEGLL